VVEDKLLTATLKNNAEKFRKRRLELALSPEIQVPRSSKFRIISAKANLSQLFDWLVTSEA
jgi:hypothetical protein